MAHLPLFPGVPSRLVFFPNENHWCVLRARVLASHTSFHRKLTISRSFILSGFSTRATRSGGTRRSLSGSTSGSATARRSRKTFPSRPQRSSRWWLLRPRLSFSGKSIEEKPIWMDFFFLPIFFFLFLRFVFRHGTVSHSSIQLVLSIGREADVPLRRSRSGAVVSSGRP
jgi:hypothetical protein